MILDEICLVLSMKKMITILFISFITNAAWAQGYNTSQHTLPVMTIEFSDSLKKEITRIMPARYTIKLSYRSKIDTNGKLLKPLIMKETADGTIADNDFVVKLRDLIKIVPAWKPARDKSLNKPVDSEVFFNVEISNGKILITDTTR